jgi:hypothetical protein
LEGLKKLDESHSSRLSAQWCTVVTLLLDHRLAFGLAGLEGSMKERSEDNATGVRAGLGLPPICPDKARSKRGSRPDGAKRFRATLTAEQAALIYTLRPQGEDNPQPNKIAGNSQLLAKEFGVSPKAVRDVWNRRTWVHATQEADLSERGLDSEKRRPVIDNNLELPERSMDCEKMSFKQQEQGLWARSGLTNRLGPIFKFIPLSQATSYVAAGLGCDRTDSFNTIRGLFQVTRTTTRFKGLETSPPSLLNEKRQ